MILKAVVRDSRVHLVALALRAFVGFLIEQKPEEMITSSMFVHVCLSG